MVLQVDVPELVHRSGLPEHTAVCVGVGEEGRQVAGEMPAGGQVVAGGGCSTTRRCG
ncbi:hypothetical protein RMT89_20910 [Streptomyces sp. P17]|nr:hypothetical protein [Streptomyces sp. P17]